MPARATVATATVIMALFATTPAPAQQDWQMDLANELLLMEDCEVSFLTQVVEREMNGRQVVMAKAHCVDGRTFDAIRDDTFAAFEFSICEPEEETTAC
jgi:hypothetical protein